MQVIVKIMTYHFDHYSLFITFNFTFLFIFYGFFGWGTKSGMIKCRTTDIPEFQNYEYSNSER